MLHKIREHFDENFCSKVQEDLSLSSKKWDLDSLELIDSFSSNCVFTGHSCQYGDIVLKVGKPCKEMDTEINSLVEYNGGHFCKIYDFDRNRGIILEEWIKPGIRLRKEAFLEKRLQVFSNLYHGLHIPSKNPELYPTYLDWVSRITQYMSERRDYEELYGYMRKARDLCKQIYEKYNATMLLHGDLHQDNILLDAKGEYKIIDPKGVIGDPVFEVSRFILNEFEEGSTLQYNYDKISAIINNLEDRLRIPREILGQCFFIETTMANCWNVEDDMSPNLQMVKMAEHIWKGV